MMHTKDSPSYIIKIIGANVDARFLKIDVLYVLFS